MHSRALYYHSAFLSIYIMELVTANSPPCWLWRHLESIKLLYALQNFTNAYSVCIEAPVPPANVCKLPLRTTYRRDTSHSWSAAVCRGIILHRGVCVLDHCIRCGSNEDVWLSVRAVYLTTGAFRSHTMFSKTRQHWGLRGPTCCSLTCVLLLKWVQLGSKSLLDNKLP